MTADNEFVVEIDNLPAKMQSDNQSLSETIGSCPKAYVKVEQE